MTMHLRLRRSLPVLFVFLLMLACTPFLSGTPAAGTPGQPASGDTTDPLDRLFSLRSVQFNLTAARPDGTGLSIDVSLDSLGNAYVQHSLPAVDPASLPDGFDVTTLPTGYDMYVVDGKAYKPDTEDPAWMTKPIDENYLKQLDHEMHGPDGPALWLDLLPEEAVQSAGQETVGGFVTDKYTVNGQIDGQTVSGALWYEPQADALVGVELHVPAALLAGSGDAPTGELKIVLTAEQKNVPPVTLPAAPTDQPGGSATPTP
jgi:hypothetical protein